MLHISSFKRKICRKCVPSVHVSRYLWIIEKVISIGRARVSGGWLIAS